MPVFRMIRVMARKAPRVAKQCAECREETPSRYRAIVDAYLCARCYELALYGPIEDMPELTTKEWV